LLLAVAATVVLVSGAGSSSSTGGTRALTGGSFTTLLDGGWSVREHVGSSGMRTFSLTSTRAPLDAEGIPTVGAIGITVSESPASALAGLASEASATNPHTKGADAIALLSAVVRPPAKAQDVAVTQPVRFRTLADASAAEAAYEYAYEGHGNVQIDVVARRRGTIYFIELDTELARMTLGEAAFARLLARWRWR
jgi:hypothetical protein